MRIREVFVSASTYPGSGPAAGASALPRYTGLAMLFHWLISAGIICNVLLVWFVDSAPEADQRPMIDLHKSIGLTVLGLAIMRVLWRYANPPPPLPASYKPWERRASHAAHMVLYGLIFLLPLTGWIHDSAWKGAPEHPLKLFWTIPWFRLPFILHQDPATKEQLHSLFSQIHGALGYVLYAMFTVHVAGALKHQFLDKEPELQRMLPAAVLPSGADKGPV
jgi:cytochrome b561